MYSLFYVVNHYEFYIFSGQCKKTAYYVNIYYFQLKFNTCSQCHHRVSRYPFK